MDSNKRQKTTSASTKASSLSAEDRRKLEEAMQAAPALFADPGDVFLCDGEGMMWGDYDPTYLECTCARVHGGGYVVKIFVFDVPHYA